MRDRNPQKSIKITQQVHTQEELWRVSAERREARREAKRIAYKRKHSKTGVSASKPKTVRKHVKTPPGLKHCNRCDTTKPVNNFYRNPSRSGYHAYCKPCHNKEVLDNRAKKTENASPTS